MNHPFTPTGATVNLAATDTTGNVAIGTHSGAGGATVLLDNAGSVAVFVAFGVSTVEAESTTGMRIPPGAIMVIGIGPAVTHIAGITASGAATLYVTPGQGV